MLSRGLVAGLLVALIGCGSTGSASECGLAAVADCRGADGGSLSSSIVVDAAWLQERLGDPDVQLVDTRSVGYETDRIPGAIQIRPDALSASVDGIPSQIMPVERAEPVLRAAGLRNGVVAVVYGVAPEYDASRIVWSLRYYGHEDVRYLDGGYDAWVAANGALDTEPPDVVPSAYDITEVDDGLRATGDWVLEQLGDAPYPMPAIQLVDARTDGEYQRGRIPTARSVDWNRNLEDGLLRPTGELEALYEGLDSGFATVTYCVTGSRGSFAWLTLTALGYEDVRLYDGSWSEWGGGDFPIEQ